jgi:hypothetical protein
VERFRSDTTFSPPRRDLSGISSGRNRDIHGPMLEEQLAAAFVAAHQLLTARDPQVQAGAAGVYLEVESAQDAKLPDLSWASKDIRLGAVRVNDMGAEVGTLFVPAAAEGFLSSKVREYARESTPTEKPKHEDRFAPLETVRAATIKSLWTDQRPFPASSATHIWRECWCWRDLAANLVRATGRLNLRTSERRLHFPEFEVIPVYASGEEIRRCAKQATRQAFLRPQYDASRISGLVTSPTGSGRRIGMRPRCVFSTAA